MASSAAILFKKDKVTTGASVRLAPRGAAPVRAVPSGRTDSCAAVRSARLVESNSEYAVIEITCACGERTFVQCDYSQLTKE